MVDMRILLQFPEGLKQKALEIAKKYESEGHEVFLSASACYGACDISLDEARWVKADKIIHFGHSRFVKADLPIPVEYVEYHMEIDVEGLSAALPLLEGKKTIALATTIQHVKQLPDMKRFLEKNKKTVLIGKGLRSTEPGQVLGCDSIAISSVATKADAILFVGNGMFHALAIDAEVLERKEMPVIVYDPYSKKARDIRKDIEMLRKKRRGAILKALSCKRFGIMVSTKTGQFALAQAIKIKKDLVKRGFEAEILVANELEPLSLNNFMVFDCYINTACPRMSDDTEEFGKPVLNPQMLEELFKIIDSGSLSTCQGGGQSD
jgi:2-(3-amino-3-carboxypropyl)histidine synthase